VADGIVQKASVALAEKGKHGLGSNSTVQGLPTTEAITDKILKEGARKLAHDKSEFASEAQSAYANRNKEEHSEVVDIVREQVQEHFGETQHDQDAIKLVQNAHEKLNRMPIDKIRENIASAHFTPEEVALKALKAGESNAVKKESGTVEEGVKGSGVEKGSDAARLQSLVDRAEHGAAPPAAQKAINMLADEVRAARAAAGSEE